jgi:hypothetical protein
VRAIHTLVANLFDCRRFGLAFLLGLIGVAPVFAQSSPTSGNLMRVQATGQASLDDIDRAATAFDDAFRRALREAANSLIIPGKDSDLDAFLAPLTREQTPTFCVLAEKVGQPALSGRVYQQAAAFTIRTDALNKRLALAAVGVRGLAGLATPPRLFLAIQDSWNPSGEAENGWIPDTENSSRAQITDTLRSRFSDFQITEERSRFGDGEDRNALLAIARREGAEVMLTGQVRSHQVVSAADQAHSGSSTNGGITTSGLSNPLDKLRTLTIVNTGTRRARIAVELEWRLIDVNNGNTLITINGQRDPASDDPSDFVTARRSAKSTLVKAKVDDLWVKLLVAWNQISAERPFTVVFGPLDQDQDAATLAARLRETVGGGAASSVVLRSEPGAPPVFSVTTRLDAAALAATLEAAFTPRWRVARSDGGQLELAPAQGLPRSIQVAFSGITFNDIKTVQDGLNGLKGITQARRLPVAEGKILFSVDTTLRNSELGAALEALLPGRLKTAASTTDRLEMKASARGVTE